MSAPRPPLLEARALAVRAPEGPWGRPGAELLRQVDLCVAPGHTLAVVGESGAGKTTLLRALLRLVRPSAGQVLIDGQDLAILTAQELRSLRRRIQVVFQDPMASLNPVLEVQTLVADPLRPGLRSPLTAALRERVVEQLAAVGLGPQFLGRRAGQLSGGQAQRVAIARALIASPQMLVCDEPVSALDVALRAQVLELLAQLRQSRQLALLLVTHDLHAARLLCDHTLVLRRGAVVEQGPTARLFSEPAAAYTRELLAAMLSVDPAVAARGSVS